MIADNQTNYIYLSELLRTDHRYAGTCKQITNILDEKKVYYDFLANTKDIWARDYMPIQVAENEFILYRYEPDYLRPERYHKIKTSPDAVLEKLGIKTKKTELILDGGNVVKSSNTVILTDKVIIENSKLFSKNEVENELADLLKVEKIVWIPWDRENEYFGHADGMIRFIDDDTVLINQYFDDYDESFKTYFYGSLKAAGLKWEKLVFDVKIEDDRNWAYINFLQTSDLILLPSFGIEEDDQAFAQIEKYFLDYSGGKIKQVNMSKIVKEGGALNCISWTIRK